MTIPSNRRRFLTTTSAVGALAGLGEFGFLQQLPRLTAADVAAPRGRVQLHADIEPLVRLIEDSDRARLLEAVADRIRQGTTYQDLLAAVMLAGVRGIQPRPVGFKFHAVLVINSAHLASLSATDRDRWLPLFWSLDNFKQSQERNRKEGNWSMSALESGKLPDGAHAAARFREAMEKWDVDGADHAVAAWSRVAGLNEVYEAFWRLGARDFRNIGHKAIFVANSYRTLQTIGWRHSEPILRSLAYALLEHEGAAPSERDDERDRPGRENAKRVTEIRRDWQRGRVSREAGTEMLQVLRTANPAEASAKVVQMLNAGIDPASVWDGLFLTAGELLIRQPGIVGLHCVTTANALYFGYEVSGNDETRRYLMLQAAAFLTMFREAMRSRGRIRDDIRLDAFEPAELSAKGPHAVEEVFQVLATDKVQASRKTLALLAREADLVPTLMAAGRRLIFARGTDSHDYKFSSAAFEDFYNVTPALRNTFLAANMVQLRPAGGDETDLTRRIRAALAK
jgi:hypothetical protein